MKSVYIYKQWVCNDAIENIPFGIDIRHLQFKQIAKETTAEITTRNEYTRSVMLLVSKLFMTVHSV